MSKAATQDTYEDAAIERLVPPVSYQGAKARLASELVDHWWNGMDHRRFYDLCCGSGAISVEMVRRGYSVDDIVMVDAGPWGLFWNEIGRGVFDFDVFCSYLDAIPSDLTLVRDWMKELSSYPAHQDTTEVFIILQAASFGGKALWIEGNAWKNNTFRNYWTPTPTSSRRSPVNPMMPMPDTLRERIWNVMQSMWGVTADCADVADVDVDPNSVVYIDPPYLGTTAYGHTIDVEAEVARISEHSLCFVSEGRKIGPEGVLVHAGRAKGGISGDRKVKANEEWLSWSGPLDSGLPLTPPEGSSSGSHPQPPNTDT